MHNKCMHVVRKSCLVVNIPKSTVECSLLKCFSTYTVSLYLL